MDILSTLGYYLRVRPEPIYQVLPFMATPGLMNNFRTRYKGSSLYGLIISDEEKSLIPRTTEMQKSLSPLRGKNVCEKRR
jgi:hypothetical protein